MENPAHGFSTGIPMSTKGNGDHSIRGNESGKLLPCGLSSEVSVFESKGDTISLINDIAQENGVCFGTSIQDGDQTDLFYNIVCGSDLPVGENVSISSPQQAETDTNVKYNEVPNIVFSDEVNSFPSVDVVVQGMDEPLENLALSVPDFKLKESSSTDVLTIQMEEQQKKLNESISAIAKSLGLEDLIPETFNVDNNKDLFSVPSDAKEDPPSVAAMGDFKQSVELHLSDLPMQFSTDSDLLDCYESMSPKKKSSESNDATFVRVPIVMSDGSTGYVVCSKDQTTKKDAESMSSDLFMNSNVDNMCFQDIEDPDHEASNFVAMDDDMESMSFETEDNEDGACNVVCAEAIECVLQTEPSDVKDSSSDVCNSATSEDNIVMSEASAGDLLSKVLEESHDKIGAEPATVSITTDSANKKMQIILMTSQGQQVIEIDTDNLGLESVSTSSLDLQLAKDNNSFPANDNRPVSFSKGMLDTENCRANLDDFEEELTCEEDIVEFVKKLSPGRSKRKTWICPVEGCGQVLSKECKLRVHMINHKGARPFKCTVDGCDWAFTTPYRLRRHFETHVGKKDYVCDFEGCNRRFTTIYNLNTHKKRHIWPNSLTCPAENCEMSFANRRKLELHLRVHDDIEAPYCCTVCGKKYYSANCIASHYRTHQYSEDDFKCPFESCGKKYDKFCRLKQHIRHHTGERPYTCPAAECKWSFMSASKLTRHMRKHTGERKFVCTEPGCGKSFMRPEHLKGHVVIHSGDKPFQCPHENCNARFTAKSSLYVHVKKHCSSGLKVVFPCPIKPCIKKYNNKTTLRQHVQKVHPAAMQDGKLLEMPEKVELTVPVSISVADGPQQTEPLSSVVSSSKLQKSTIRSMPTIVSGQQGLRQNAVKVTKAASTSAKGKESHRSLKFIVPNLSSSPKCTATTTDVTAGCLSQENSSGSARTDYCCNRVSGSSKKLWTLQNRVHLGLASQSDDTRSSEISTTLLSSMSQSSTSLRSPDVLLASSSVALHNSTGEQLSQTHFLPDDPSTSSIYHEDSILVNNPDFGSELPMSSSLLSEDSDSNSSMMVCGAVSSSFSASNGVDDFGVSSINLQCLD